jgi:hypothetical protein
MFWNRIKNYKGLKKIFSSFDFSSFDYNLIKVFRYVQFLLSFIKNGIVQFLSFECKARAIEGCDWLSRWR